MNDQFKRPRDRIIVEVHFNEKLKKFLDSIQDPTFREVAVRTIDWVKDTYPECKRILNGELVYKEIKED